LVWAHGKVSSNISLALALPTTSQGQFGTSENDTLKASIIHALHNGYRLIDTAQYYGVEAVVGSAIRASGVPRSEITVITKFWGVWHHDPAMALTNSLRDLGIEYIDIFLMHWPTTMTPDEQPMEYPGQPPFWAVWKAMEKLVGDRCRAIGVSNFTQKTLETLLEGASLVPVVNEVELHALNPNLKLVPYCLAKGIRVMSWSTLGSERYDGAENPILTNGLFTDIAKKHGCSTALVSLSWAVQRGVVVIPKSSKLHRIEENIKLVSLDETDVEALNQAHTKLGRIRLSDTIPGIQYVLPGGKKTIMGWTKAEFGWEDEEGNWLC
jgi:glycerol 2-dehydrogenase (NADP+)